jgi:hypothetical protein
MLSERVASIYSLEVLDGGGVKVFLHDEDVQAKVLAEELGWWLAMISAFFGCRTYIAVTAFVHVLLDLILPRWSVVVADVHKPVCGISVDAIGQFLLEKLVEILRKLVTIRC